ncbi:MAG: hypothetical protein ACOX5Z_01230 [Desulfobulbus sp.]|jgi:hypothetical protein
MLMLLIKLAVSMGMVITITWIAERISSRFAGVLLGFPLGAGVTLLFVGIEQGAVFAGQCALWTMQGLPPTLLWCLGYLATARKLEGQGRAMALLLCLLASMAVYLLSAWLTVRLLPQSFAVRLVLALAGLTILALVFRRLDPGPVRLARPRPGPLAWLGRALLTGLIVLAITECAKHVSSQWAGVFSAFPATILPVVLILHASHGADILPSLFREMPMGMLAIIVFSLVVAWSFPLWGVGLGMVMSYGVATLYLLLYEGILRKPLQRLLDRLAAP